MYYYLCAEIVRNKKTEWFILTGFSLLLQYLLYISIMFHGIVWNYDTLIGQNGIGQYYKCNSFSYLCGNVVDNSDHTCLNNKTLKYI